MRVFLTAFLIWAGASLTAGAQVQLGEHHVFDTRFGQVQVVGGDVDQQLWFAGESLPLPTAELYWIRGAFGAEDEDVDWVIASSHHRGNMCGGYIAYFIVEVSAEGARVSPEINACVGILDVRPLPGRVEVDLAHADLEIAREVFAFDGSMLTSTLVPEETATPAGPGAEVTRWIGAQVWEVLDDASERARFGTVMSAEELDALAAAMGLPSDIVEQDGWIIATGCQQHACNLNMGAFGIRIADGAVAAALFTGNGEEVLQRAAFGLADDPVFAAALEVFRP